jgi:hypothetical protein
VKVGEGLNLFVIYFTTILVGHNQKFRKAVEGKLPWKRKLGAKNMVAASTLPGKNSQPSSGLPIADAADTCMGGKILVIQGWLHFAIHRVG